MMIRSPGRGYGIHVSACVQARSDAAMSAGQIDGTTIPDGQSANILVASHRIIMDAVP